MTAKRLVLLAGAAVFAVTLLVLATSPDLQPKLKWRVRWIGLALAGSLPNVNWTDTLATLLPSPDPPESFAIERQEDGGPCPVLWQTPLGTFWGRENDGPILRMIIFEQFVQDIYQQDGARIAAGDVVVDVGAHLGVFTRYALREGAGKVVAFEPEPINLVCLGQTFDGDIRAGRVELVPKAAWEESGTLKFTTNTVNSSAGTVIEERVSNPGSITEIPAITMDEAIAALGLAQVDFIKMDIEGAERHALKGSRAVLSRFSPKLAICIYHRADDREAVPAVILDAQPNYRVSNRGHMQMYFY
ncbi:MAG: FkbM family methyltransferase [Acidobacteria bacterium]|nr:FkbM family methyltransferase [Acidobacteriota bacterium]